MAKILFTHNLSEPLGGATCAKFDINTGSGNLTIDALAGNEPVLASGTLEYLQDQGLPSTSVDAHGGEVTLTLRARSTRQPQFRLPWATCSGATDWRIHLNSTVTSDVTARSGGGNVRVDLTGAVVTQVSAETGGGNVDVVLPDNAARLCTTARSGAGNVSVEVGRGAQGSSALTARSGAGNVVVRVPADLAAHIHLTTGMGKAIVDPRFTQIDKSTYESPDYQGAADRVEITATSGAGNVTVETK